MLMTLHSSDNGCSVCCPPQVFSSVQRLAQSFIDLYSAGNMLFRSWAAYVYCSPRSKACTSMDFCLKAIPKLVGRGEVTALLPQLCRTMESFLVRWKDFVSEKRSRYFYLNYYTAEQLVYLCGELTKGQPSERALMMLSFVKQNCTERDVDVACRRVVSRHTHTSFPDLPAVLATEDLPVQLKRVWGSYMEDMRAFLPNCLDMDALGSCLDHLAHREKQHVRRALPQCLQAGRPNLITCPRAEVLASALAIYMSSPGQPLPTFDEVLLCTPETSLEQVGLFLRRCLTPSDRGKIYTMLYADELSYDVGCRAEELFQRLLKQSHLDSYCLVILCDCEREHCYIPSAFSQYKVHATPQEELKDIQEYLRSHFVVTQPTKSAASVFKDHMCVRIVSSKRAGVGKMLGVTVGLFGRESTKAEVQAGKRRACVLDAALGSSLLLTWGFRNGLLLILVTALFCLAPASPYPRLVPGTISNSGLCIQCDPASCLPELFLWDMCELKGRGPGPSGEAGYLNNPPSFFWFL